MVDDDLPDRVTGKLFRRQSADAGKIFAIPCLVSRAVGKRMPFAISQNSVNRAGRFSFDQDGAQLLRRSEIIVDIVCFKLATQRIKVSSPVIQYQRRTLVVEHTDRALHIGWVWFNITPMFKLRRH